MRNRDCHLIRGCKTENKEKLLVIKVQEVLVIGIRHERGMTAHPQLLQTNSTSVLKYSTWHRH